MAGSLFFMNFLMITSPLPEAARRLIGQRLKEVAQGVAADGFDVDLGRHAGQQTALAIRPAAHPVN